MALAINIDDLLNKQRIESNRIEFKKGWNPVSIYHSVCAFANDFDDLGGGYIVVGVDTDDKTGVAIRPVEGIPIEEIDNILQDMVGYNNKIAPYYMPRTSTEEVDGKTVLVIWCPAGINRPYSVPENVTAKNGSRNTSISAVEQAALSPKVRCWMNFANLPVVCHLMKGATLTFVWKTYPLCFCVNTW